MATNGGDPQDRALLARVSVGDVSAMRALYIAHSEAVLRFVQTRLRDRIEAADVVHDTMLEVWRSAGRFEGRSSVRSWILGMARNKAVDHIRKQSRVTLGEPDKDLASDQPNPEAVIAAADDAERVRECVEKLPDHQRSAVHLAFFEDMNYAEIASVDEVPENTVKTRIFHAKKLLMRCLSRFRDPESRI